MQTSLSQEVRTGRQKLHCVLCLLYDINAMFLCYFCDAFGMMLSRQSFYPFPQVENKEECEEVEDTECQLVPGQVAFWPT